MHELTLGNSHIKTGAMALGCMRMADLTAGDAAQVIETAAEVGMNLFDHADIYAKGEAETRFAEAFTKTSLNRDDVLLQSKCGIQKGWYDFSKAHIIQSVEDSLKRLGTDYLDTFLLHRPDALMEPEEVAAAFDELEAAGKVRFFGVSNHNPHQIALLKQAVTQPLLVNQLQFSLVHTPLIDAGLNVNMRNDAAVVRENGILEYCRLNNMTIQAWSPFQHGMIEGVFIGHPDFPNVNHVLEVMAAEKHTNVSALAAAWILRHPAKMQPIIGSMNPSRIQEIAEAVDVTLSREEWYELYRAAGNDLP
ncbi:putative oxidoreductase [Salsuginibacillus halophilus]|uniref:Putative oxidoreductase n=1 Tax=Salsuginibacillus halophilus TaxID=517424 RepID=A0A2P8HAK4_9BACI|nr:aldo/keto reductase [Salsuginibacillus halophilus]PSL43230.1 putative oxidoreductase [Salsuginibacillus halophilus]